MKNEKIDYNLILVAAIIIGGIYIFRKIGGAGSGLLSGLGLTNTDEENQQLNEIRNENFWNFSAFLNDAPAGALLMTMANAREKVNLLWDATGIFNDDEEQIYGVFRNLKTKSQIAFLSKVFFDEKNQDLYSYLDNYLNDGEMITLKGIIDSKPLYNL